jgi:hypothetical protein
MQRMTPLLRQRLDALRGEEFGMPEAIEKRAMEIQAVFDRVLVWQLPDSWYGSEKFEGSVLYTPEATQERQRQDTPRGIIVSAGLNAMDVLRSHGIPGPGAIVTFCVNSYYRLPLDGIRKHHLGLLRVGDIVASQDLAELLDAGACKVNLLKGEHRLVDKEGRQWEPLIPGIEV